MRSPLLPPQVLLGPGARWKAVKEALPPSQFTYVHGQCGSVGVGGFLLGGGHNPATSARYGFGADNVDEYTVVTANGSIVRVRQKKHTASCYVPTIFLHFEPSLQVDMEKVTWVDVGDNTQELPPPLLHSKVEKMNSCKIQAWASLLVQS